MRVHTAPRLRTTMDETSPLFEGYETLSGARERGRAARAERRTWGRALGWLARWLFGVVPAGVGSLWMLSAIVASDAGVGAVPLMTVIAAHAVLVIGALLVHPGLARRDRRLGTFALGVSTGLALSLCAWDAARAVRLLRGRAFGVRDCAWILHGLLLAVAACLGSGAWWMDVVP